ncbi:unnamed protein product [Danaus chrysippus]|uniref:(African queen) hypothetical protein n=1 Tax=Danaus chrysippus TaxID=151541 RepID=A0A8J2QDF8_9NEOP|nr:unnamed protein product [Danaus chrysippus]
MMFLLAIFSVIASALALPVIPDPPSLPNRNVSVLHHLDFHTRNVKPFKVIVEKDNENGVKTNSNLVLPTQKQTASDCLDCVYLQKQLYELKEVLKKTNQGIKIKNIPEENKNNKGKENEPKVKLTMGSIPPPPELPPFDYSTLKKQKYEQNKPQRTTTEKITYEDIPEQDNNDENENVNIEVASVTVPPPPALPPHDYSTLQKQKYEQKQQPEPSTERVNYEDIPEQDNNDKSEKKNVKVTLVAVPPPPTLPPFDYSTLKKQKHEQNKPQRTTTEKISYEVIPEQDNNGNDETEKVNIEVVSVTVPPPPALPPHDYSTLQKQKYEQKQQEPSTERVNYEDIPEQDNNDKSEKKNVKVTLVAVPPPPTLPPFDYSTLKKQKYEQNKPQRTTTEKISYEVIPEQDNNGNDETEKVNIEVVSVTVPPPPALPPHDYSTLQKQKYEQKQQPEPSTERVNYEDIPEQDNNDKSEKKNVKVTLVAVPPPPTLPPFDYSTLKKQKYEQNKPQRTTTEKISYEVIPEQDNNGNDETEKVNIEVVSVTVPPPPALPPHDYSTLQKQKYEQKQQPEPSTERVNYEDILEQDNNDKSEKKNVKVTLVAVPPPPTLPPFDYSTLKKQKYEQNKPQRTTTEKISYEVIPEQDNNGNDETEKVNIEVVSVTVPPPPALPPHDYSTLQKQKYEQKQQPEPSTERVNYEDIPEQDNNDKSEKKNVKVTLVAVPPPPTLPPFDYSTLKKQKYEQNKPQRTTTEKISYQATGELKGDKTNVALVGIASPSEIRSSDYSYLNKNTIETNQTKAETNEKPERLYPSLPKFGMQCLCRVPSIPKNRRVLCNLPLDIYQR